MSKGKSKHIAVRTQASSGTWCASKKEAARLSELRLLEKAGEIQNLVVQPEFPIFINGKKVFTYVADAAYFDGKRRIVEDTKGVRTQVYRLKARCVEAYYNIQIMEI